MDARTHDFTEKEMMTVFLARDLRDGERVTAGAYPEICLGAAMLAQKTHAPNLILQAGGNCFFCNVSGRDCTIYPSSADYRNLEWAEAVSSHPEAMRVSWKRDKMFVGGIQVDQYGNCNLFGIGFSGGKWRFRGPGMVGVDGSLTFTKEVYLFVTQHSRRVLVERVDYVSAVGFGAGPGTRESLGLPGRGPKYIVTPKAVFDFDAGKRARLCGLMPGVGIEWVKRNTGFDPGIARTVPEIEPPTVRELTILRSMDKLGLLRK